MRRSVAPLLLALAACASDRDARTAPLPRPSGAILHAAELARVRCLLVAPFENGSDAPQAADAATAALLSGVEGKRTRVFPVTDLRALFRDTALELPQGLSPSLALELAGLVGADAALWGSVEGHAHGGGELLVTMRLSLTGDHRLLFADTALVRLAPGVKPEKIIARAVLAAAGPMLERLGAPEGGRCFDAERTRTLRRVAMSESGEPAARSTAVATPPAAAPASAHAPPPSRPQPQPRTARQLEFAKRLADGGRILVEDVAFAGRSAALQRDGGLADLAVALAAHSGTRVRIEAFVDATSDRAGDARLAAAMAEATGRRLLDLGVPRDRLTWVGRGGESPILPNFTVRGRAANRRVEVVVVP
jgi:outer membrane protein OmpA-like peptidoglycan-associated protein